MKTSTVFDTPPLFIDTWGWLALEDSQDRSHSEVERLREKYAHHAGLWITTDYVLDETITRLFARRPFPEAERFCAGLFKAERGGELRLERITAERFQQAYRLRLRYRDKPRISFTDLTSFAVMKELKITHALTRDAHFQQSQLGFVTLP